MGQVDLKHLSEEQHNWRNSLPEFSVYCACQKCGCWWNHDASYRTVFDVVDRICERCGFRWSTLPLDEYEAEDNPK